MNFLKKHWFEILLALLALWIVSGIVKGLNAAANSAESAAQTVANLFNPANWAAQIKTLFSGLFAGGTQPPAVQAIPTPATGPITSFLYNPSQGFGSTGSNTPDASVFGF